MYFLYGILFLIVIIGGYIITSYYNRKTEVPESCQEKYLEAQSCTLCGQRNTCSISKLQDLMKETKL